MIQLKNLSQRLGCTIVVKCEWMNGITGRAEDRVAKEIIEIAKKENQTTLIGEIEDKSVLNSLSSLSASSGITLVL